MTTDRILYQISVPEQMRNVVDDTPEEYRIVFPNGVKVACMIYGRYGRRWHANCSARWLVRHLLDALMDTMQKERLLDMQSKQILENAKQLQANVDKLANAVRGMIEYMPTYEGETRGDTGSITLEFAQRLLREIGNT